jgi:hypothetical protein
VLWTNPALRAPKAQLMLPVPKVPKVPKVRLPTQLLAEPSLTSASAT